MGRTLNLLLLVILLAAAHTCAVSIVSAQTAPPPSFVSTTLPNGAANVLYGADIQVTGGQQPYTFSVSSGALPAGFSLTTMQNVQGGTVNAGHISGAPTAPGAFTFGITVFDSLDQAATATISLTIGPAPPNTQPALLNGQYALLIQSFGDSDNEEQVVAGSLKFDGSGGITGVIDLNDSSNGVQEGVAVTGTYSVGPDSRGFLTITAAGMGGNFQAAIAVGNVYRGVASTVRLTAFNDNDGNDRIGSGFLRLQYPTAFNQNSFAGTYVFSGTGQTPAFARAAEVGIISFDNMLNVTSGGADVNEAGAISSITSFGGTYMIPDANGRVVLSLTQVPTSSSVTAVYIISASEVIFITLNNQQGSDLLVGSALKQANPGAFTNASLAGPDIVRLYGVNGSGAHSSIGVVTASIVGTTPTATITADSNDAGTLSFGQTFSGTFSVAANGRAPIFIASPPGGGGPSTLFLYLASQDRAFAMTDDGSVNVGDFLPQIGAPFITPPFSGNEFLGLLETLEAHEAVSATGIFSAPSTFNVTSDDSHVGGDLAYGQSQGALTFTPDSTGHFTIPPGPGNTGGLTGYVVSPFEADFLDTSNSSGTSMHPHLFLSQTVAAPPGTPSPATTTVNFPTSVAIGMTAMSAPRTITNVGMGPIAFPSTDTSESPDFSAAGTCLPVSFLPVFQPQQSCTVTITFAPTASTPTGSMLIETLIVNTDGSTNVTFTVTGTATGGGAGQLTPNPFTFTSPTRLGQSQIATGAVTLANTGGSPFTITAVTNAADFSAASACFSPLPDQIAPGASCTINLTFAPLLTTAPGALSETIAIATSAGPLLLTVKGTATAPAVTFAPTTVAFGAVNIGAPSSTNLTLTNTGTAVLNVAGFAIAGPNAADFTQTNTCSGGASAVLPNATCTITITFTPSVTGNESATLQVMDDAATSPQMVPLTGIGASTSAGFTFTVPNTPGGGSGTTASVLPGDTAVFTLTLQPNAGFIGPIALACVSTIPATIATASPVMVNVTTSPSAPINIMCTLQTNCVTSLLAPRAPINWPGTPGPMAPFTAAATLALLLALCWRKVALACRPSGRHGWATRLAPLWATFLLLLLVMTWTACVSNPPPTIPGAPTTPAGVYQIQVVATAPGGAKQTVSLTVHVI